VRFWVHVSCLLFRSGFWQSVVVIPEKGRHTLGAVTRHFQCVLIPAARLLLVKNQREFFTSWLSANQESMKIAPSGIRNP
jgi:hypothetical protein